MATAKKTAKAVPVKKPVAPVVVAKSDEPGAITYRVTGRINHNGETLRPADPATDRKADTIELTEREAFDLRGFVEPVEDDASDAPAE